MAVNYTRDAQFNPAAQSLDYQASKEDWDLVTALLGGTRAMREAGETYLPTHAEETDEQYEDRLQSSVLFNAFEEAVDGVVARVFSEPVILKEDALDLFRAHSDDITGLGENLDCLPCVPVRGRLRHFLGVRR